MAFSTSDINACRPLSSYFDNPVIVYTRDFELSFKTTEIKFQACEADKVECIFLIVQIKSKTIKKCNTSQITNLQKHYSGTVTRVFIIRYFTPPLKLKMTQHAAV